MQVDLQFLCPEFRMPMRNIQAQAVIAHLFVFIRPTAGVAYEHVFSRSQSSRIADLTGTALRTARSFLLLEGDEPVDWEVDEDEQARAAHPHREPLRGRPSHARRAGQPPSPAQVCLCPIARRGHVAPEPATRRSPAPRPARTL